MHYKWIGAALVIAGCGGFGFSLAANHRREEGLLLQLIHALDFMECELQYRLTPLPQLCRQAAMETKGLIKNLLLDLARELEQQISPDVISCMNVALAARGDVPHRMKSLFRELGHCLGRFDLPGQLQGLESVRSMCRRELDNMSNNRDVRLRSYQTLGLCAGAGLAILFI